jgi:hypothetical protein
MITRLE